MARAAPRGLTSPGQLLCYAAGQLLLQLLCYAATISSLLCIQTLVGVLVSEGVACTGEVQAFYALAVCALLQASWTALALVQKITFI